MLRIRLSLVQLIFIPIGEVLAIFFLSNWMRDLIVLEWDVLKENMFLTQALGLGILGVIVLFGIHIIYCIIKMYYLTTKFVSADDLEKELKKIKES